MDVINLEKAVRLMDGDQELFSDLFEIIEKSLPEKYANVEQAIAAESAVDLELYAHQFKGALRTSARVLKTRLARKSNRDVRNDDLY